MYEILFQSHSGLRFIVLFALTIATILAFAGWLGHKPFTKTNKVFNLLTLISTHLQVVLGIILYFFSPFVQLNNMAATMKTDTLRYWTVEHGAMMIIAVILITVGHVKSKKASGGEAKNRTAAIFFGLAFLLIIAGIVLGGRPLLAVSH